MTRVVFKPDHILAVYARASEEARAAGRAWYPEAHALACELAGHESSVLKYAPDAMERASGILAALSPQMPWPRNQVLARLAIARGQASGTFGAAIRQADAILSGTHPLDVLKGPKVRSFYHCILEAGKTEDVCVDRHAVLIARGGRPLPFEHSIRVAQNYRRAQDAYREAATHIGMYPAVLQAITWVQWRREQNISAETGIRRGPRI